MKIVRVMFGIFFVSGLGMLIGSYFTYQHMRKFLGTAIETAGVVVDLVERESSDDNGTSTSYHPRVRFRTAEGQSIEFVSKTGSNPPKYSVNQTVKVLYNPRQPSEAYINSFAPLWFTTVLLAVLGLAFMSPAFGYSIWRRLSDRKAAWLRENGRRLQAEIKSVELRANFEMNGRHPYRIVCQWLDPARNEVHVFHSKNIWFDPAEFLQGKTALNVWIDPNNPRRFLVDTSFLPGVG